MINLRLNQASIHGTSGQVIIRFNPKTDKKTIENYHNKINAKVIEKNDMLNFQVVTSTKSVDDMLKYYKAIKEVNYVIPNQAVHIATT